VLADDLLVGPLLAARPGLRPAGSWDGFEAGVLAVLAERRSLGAARSRAGRLVERAGASVPGLEQLALTHTFPSPAELARADLTGLGLARAEEAALRSFACAVDDDAIRLDGSVGLDKLVGSITRIGLSEQTAHSIALRLGEPDAFPLDDPQSALPQAAAAALAERWRPWRALAATHLQPARAPAAAAAEAA
jgi:AraC family transcriptional regulator of adaptative response / DNA-3-methyladenine glycosylase II